MPESTISWTQAMRAGRYEEAWAMEAATIAARDPATRDDPTMPYHRRWVWDGRPIEDRDVLVRCYHGLGDTIQFARYLPALTARARSVTLEVQLRLVPLLDQLGLAEVRAFDVDAPSRWRDVAVEITELPAALRIPPERLAAPYLRWPAADLPARAIGLCPVAGDWDADRSIPIALFRPLCEARPCVMLATGATTLPCLNPGGCPPDMAATAALVAAVDLVVTADTMIAHLAGAMGKPVRLLLKAEPDWRWPPGATRSAWYPTMRLHTQPRAGDWPAVIDELMADLVPDTASPRSFPP